MLCDSTNITLEQHAHFAMVCHNLCNLLVLFMQLLIIRVGGRGGGGGVCESVWLLP